MQKVMVFTDEGDYYFEQYVEWWNQEPQWENKFKFYLAYDIYEFKREVEKSDIILIDGGSIGQSDYWSGQQIVYDCVLEFPSKYFIITGGLASHYYKDLMQDFKPQHNLLCYNIGEIRQYFWNLT